MVVLLSDGNGKYSQKAVSVRETKARQPQLSCTMKLQDARCMKL